MHYCTFFNLIQIFKLFFCINFLKKAHLHLDPSLSTHYVLSCLIMVMPPKNVIKMDQINSKNSLSEITKCTAVQRTSDVFQPFQAYELRIPKLPAAPTRLLSGGSFFIALSLATIASICERRGLHTTDGSWLVTVRGTQQLMNILPTSSCVAVFFCGCWRFSAFLYETRA